MNEEDPDNVVGNYTVTPTRLHEATIMSKSELIDRLMAADVRLRRRDECIAEQERELAELRAELDRLRELLGASWDDPDYRARRPNLWARVAPSLQRDCAHGQLARQCPLCEAAADLREARERAEKAERERDRLRAGITAVEELIRESRGVIGLHLNGDEAPWDDLLEGGRMEEWLLPFSAALREEE